MRHAMLLVLGSLVACGCAEEKRVSSAASTMTNATSLPAATTATNAISDDARAKLAAQEARRKIIYTVNLDLYVRQFDGIQEHVETLVHKYPGAYVSAATLSGTKGVRRGGQWTIRVPQEQHDTLTAELRSLGEVHNENKQSQEVTEQFYDLAARLKNHRETEKRMVKIQEERTAGLDQVLIIEREIARVREQIEQVEGRLNLLDDLTSLTTIRLSIAEVQAFHGPELAFSDRLSGEWNDSVGKLREVGKAITLFCVGAAPWLPIFAMIALAMRFVVRRSLRRVPRHAAM